jgi:hypothetical protein
MKYIVYIVTCRGDSIVSSTFDGLVVASKVCFAFAFLCFLVVGLADVTLFSNPRIGVRAVDPAGILKQC